MLNDEEIREIDNTILSLFNKRFVEIICSKCEKITIPECSEDLKHTVCCGEEVIIRPTEKGLNVL